MPNRLLENAIAAVPAGRWAIGVSGGADSVALLSLLHSRADLHCHIVHLNHETRGPESEADAQFVRQLATTWKLEITLARRSEIEPLAASLPPNPSARFRALRFLLFRQACTRHQLAGVILAHHADDQAETILQRLLRGSAPAGLMGITPQVRLGGLHIVRPLVQIPSRQLREHLRSIGQAWREDASNASPKYQRNRVRALLARAPNLSDAARQLGATMADLVSWARSAAPRLPENFAPRILADAPQILAGEAARQWLIERGALRDQLSATVLQRLIDMARDAASAPRQDFPGGVSVSRRAGKIQAASSPASAAANPESPPDAIPTL